MKKRFGYFLILCLFAFFVVPKFVFGADYSFEKIFYLSQANIEEGVKSLNQNWQKVDIIAPQMYSVAPNLLLYGKLGPKLKKSISDHNLKVMPLVVNASFKQTTIHNLLLSQKAQDSVINGLVTLAKKDNYIGWQYDFENISYLDKDLYSAFVERTYKAFQQNNLALSVTVVARSVDYEDTNAFKNWSGVYDFKKIADNSDFITLMAYDDPNSKGPTASVDFVNKALAYAKDKIPAEKLSLGVPLYYWKWNADTNKKVGSGLFKTVAAIMSNIEHFVSFDPKLGVSCLSYSYNNKNYKVWFEDKQSFTAKLDIIKNNNLRGFSAWVLGGEDPNMWNALDKNS